MEVSSLLQVFKELGFPIGMVIVLIWWVIHMDKQNRIDTNKQMERLDKNIEDLKTENREDKKLFQSAIATFNASSESFSESVKEFKSVNKEMNFVQNELKDIKVDLTLIKEKVK